MKKRVVLLLVTLILLSLAACGDSPVAGSATPAPTGATGAPQATESPAAAETEAPVEAPAYQSLIQSALNAGVYDDTVTYDELMRTPDELAGTRVYLTGKIIQIMQGNGLTAYRFAMSGDSGQMIYVESYPEFPVDTLIEGDYAALSGIAYGLYTYQAVLGNTVTLPAVLAAKLEHAEMPMPALPEYPTGPLILLDYYSSGRLASTTEIESFTITNAEIAYSGDLHITCEVIGTVSGSAYLTLDAKCYDDEGFLLATKSLRASVSDGERFKVTDDAYIPANTARIELAAG